MLIVGLISGLAGVAYGSSHPYISDPGTLLEGFENVADWTVTGAGATAQNDANLFTQGSQSIQVNAVNGNYAYVTKSDLTLDLSVEDIFSFWVYIPDKSKLSNIIFYVTSTTSFSKYFSRTFSIYKNGWNNLVLPKSRFTNTGSESWNNVMVKLRFRLNLISGQDISINFDELRFGIEGKTKIIVTFDDGWNSQIDKGYPIMAANGQRGVAFITTNAVGTGSYMTLAELTTLRDAGWDISNHTAAHKHLATVSQEEMEADIDGGYDWLVANGFGNTAKFFAYPYGGYNDAVVTKVKERHILARKTSLSTYAHFKIVNYYDLQYTLDALSVANYISVASVETEISTVIEAGGLLILLFHKIVDSDAYEGTEYLTADFQAISDYLKTKQDAGLLEVITFCDYYNALIEVEPFCLKKPAMDFNGDCKVDFADYALFTQSWLECNLDPESACWE